MQPITIIEDDNQQLQLLQLVLQTQRPDWRVHSLLADTQTVERLLADPEAVLGETGLVLLDSHLGDVTALELLPVVGGDRPVVVLCGGTGSIDRARCLELGACEVQPKPYDVDGIAGLLKVCDRCLTSVAGADE